MGDIFLNIFIAFLCGLLIAFFYKVTYRGPGYTVAFLNSLIVLSMITAIVIIVIGDNLARAFGLVGAMSIIRFRTAVKETLDIIFLFFSLAVGMAAGVGLYSTAIAGTVFIGLILVFLTKFNLVSSSRQEYLLQFTFKNSENAEESTYLEILNKHCRNNKLINSKTIGLGNELELSFYVDLKNKHKSSELIRELKKLTEISNVNLYFDEEKF